MSDTHESKRVNQTYVRGDKGRKTATTGEAGIYPGYLIRIGTDGLAYLCKNTDGPASGVVINPRGTDMDTVIGSDVEIDYYPIGQNVVVWIFLLYASPAVPVRMGDVIMVSATDGFGMTWGYVDTAELTDALETKVGRSDSVDTGHVTNSHLIKVNLAG